jgi:serine O-acetyltransferase
MSAAVAPSPPMPAPESPPPTAQPPTGLTRRLATLPHGDVNQNPQGMTLGQLLREDLHTHDDQLSSPGFWALAVHRLGNWRMGVKSRALRPPLSALYRVAYHGVIALWGIDLPYNCRLGRRIRFEHHGCVFIGVESIGDDVVFRHSATVGLKDRHSTQIPTIGSRVEVGPGACVVGGISVGDDSYIGANTVLADDLPAGGAVLGNPARTVKLDDLVSPKP